MAEQSRKPGLHKDVRTIFNGVWNEQSGDIDFTGESPGRSCYVWPKPLIIEHQKTTKKEKTEPKKVSAKTSSVKTHKQEWNKWFFISTKKRREKKRLLSISKYLLPPEE